MSLDLLNKNVMPCNTCLPSGHLLLLLPEGTKVFPAPKRRPGDELAACWLSQALQALDLNPQHRAALRNLITT